MRNLKALVHVFADACVRFGAVIAVISLAMGMVRHTWDGTWIWRQGGVFPLWVTLPLVGLFALAVTFGHRIREPDGVLARRLGLVLAIVCLVDALGFYRALADARVDPASSAPPTLAIAALLLVWIGTARARSHASDSHTRRAVWLQVVDPASR